MGGDLTAKTPLLPLPPGVYFRPSEQQLLSHYLAGNNREVEPTCLPWKDLIPRINLYEYDPSDLPVTNNRYYCFTSPRKRVRSRKAKGGVWKNKRRGRTVAIEKDGVVLGTKKSFVFYRRRTGLPREKTHWVLDEYALTGSPTEDCLCCVRLKSQSLQKRLKHSPTAALQEKIPARPINNDIGNLGQQDNGVLASPTDEQIGQNTTLMDVDELESILMKLTDEAEEGLPATDGVLGDLTAIGRNTLEIVEGDYLELDDLLSPITDIDSLD